MTHGEELRARQDIVVTEYVEGYAQKAVDAAVTGLRADLEAAKQREAELNHKLTNMTADRDDALEEVRVVSADLTAAKAKIAELEAIIRDLEAGEPAPDPAYLEAWGGLPVFREEFDKPGLFDRTKWNVRDDSTFGKLNDVTILDDTLCYADDKGVGHIVAKWRSTFITTSTGPSSPSPTVRTHDSGYVDHRAAAGTGLIYEQQYGRWEIRCKTPTGVNTLGALAAFWLRNSKSGEIDIMEAWGFGTAPLPNGQRDGTSTWTVHNKTSGGTGYAKYAWTLEEELKKKGIIVPKAYEAMRTVAFEYTPTYAAIYIEGHLAARATPTSHPMLWDAAFFGAPLHLRMNLHVGPSTTYYGLPKPDQKHLTQDPLDFQIEHVRIWKMPAAA